MADFYTYLQKQAADSPEAGHTLRNLLATLIAGGTALATHKLQPGIARGIGRQGAASWKSLLNTLIAKLEPAGKSVASQLAGMSPKFKSTEQLDRAAGGVFGSIARKTVDDLMDRYRSYLKDTPIRELQEHIRSRDTMTPYFRGLSVSSPFRPGSPVPRLRVDPQQFLGSPHGAAQVFGPAPAGY